MAKEIRVIIVGAAGVQGKALVKLLVDGGCTIVGAVGRTSHIGEDAGTVAGIDPLGVPITRADELEQMLIDLKPDIVVDSSAPGLPSVYPTLKLCAEHGVDVAELSEEAAFPQAADAAIYEELDAICKRTGATIYATGYQDIAWNAYATAAMATCVNIKRVYGEEWMIADFFHEIAGFLTGSGLTREEFDRDFGSELHLKGYEFILQQIAQELDLTITKSESSVEFVELEEDYAIPNTDKVVPAGNAWGSKTHVHFETEEGIDLDGCFIGGYMCQGAAPRAYWKVEGDPGVELTAVCDDAERQTVTDVVNRLPDIINAPAGFLLIQDMPKYSYKAKPLPTYVK